MSTPNIASGESVVDPVCGMSVDPHTAKHRHQHAGRTYYFCSNGCRTKFFADPKRYLDEANTNEPVPADTIYTCPMHPQIRQMEPGSCPICGMALAGEPAAASATKPLAAGILAFLAMLGVYFGVLTLVSGWSFTISEFARFWYYVLALALGFGSQIGLYVYLKQRLAHHRGAGKMVVASGTTSTAAMISCCAHYLTNVLPIIGAAGVVTLIAQYQVELFWIGLTFNAGGIIYIASKVFAATRYT